jgi:hypothetical protein
MSTTLIIIFSILGAAVFLIFILPLLMKGKYSIEKSIEINKPLAHTRERVVNLNHYRTWNPWQLMEPTSKQVVTGTPDTIGHKYEWEGKKIGMGSLTLKRNGKNEVIFDLNFIKPFKSHAEDCWYFEEKGNVTKVTWKNEGRLPYPMGRLMGPMISKQLNHQFLAGLRNLKMVCEQA